MLSQAERLDTETLIECARTKNQEHLLAISRRKTLPEALTDVLVERGDQQIVLSTAKNNGARFSSTGFNILVRRSKGDDQLTACVGARPDLPPQLFEQRLDAASEAVRAKLVAERRHAKSDIDQAVDEVSGRERSHAQSLSYAAVQVLIESMHQAGLLNAAKLEEFARAGRFEEMVAALSRMSNVPTAVIERNMRDTHAESLLVLAKAVGSRGRRHASSISAHRAAISFRGQHHNAARAAFQRLRQSTAQQILEFHRLPERPARRH